MEEKSSTDKVGYRLETDDLSFWTLLAIYKTGNKQIIVIASWSNCGNLQISAPN